MNIRNKKFTTFSKTSKVGGFTLVETLIAITVMMVAVVGPMTIANKALTSALAARSSMIASYLAQDGMESIKNIKDTAAKTVAEDQVFVPLGYDGTVADVSSCKGPSIDLSCATPEPDSTNIEKAYNTKVSCVSSNSTVCKLYINESDGAGGGYRYDTGGSGDRTSPYSRYYYIEKVPSVGIANQIFVTVIVSWTERGVYNEIRIRNLMTNTFK